MEYHKEYLQKLIEKGGPSPDDYYDLDAWILEIYDLFIRGQILKEEVQSLINLLEDASSTDTMQGFAFQKPHGYAGDFEIIDRIYKRYVTKISTLSNWDTYFQTHAATKAVRNRVHYLCRLIIDLKKSESFNVLNVASGPGRDMLHFFQENSNSDVHFDCIEQDENAIIHAKSLCKDYIDNISFYQKNALRYKSDKKYDLIWSAGLFDYFEDKTFIAMLKRFAQMASNSGDIVVGNFSTINPSRPYMELFEWNLHHRSPQTLRAIAKEAGFKKENIRVEKEETGVNLFLHLKV